MPAAFKKLPGPIARDLDTCEQEWGSGIVC